MNTFKTRANGAAQRNATLISRMPEFLFPIGAASMLAGCACDENVLNLAIGLFSLSVSPSLLEDTSHVEKPRGAKA